MCRIKCPCCGYYTFDGKSEEEIIFEICDVCFWQYDPVANHMPDKVIGANKLSLEDSKRNFKRYGAVQKVFLKKVRAPKCNELIENNEGQKK